MQKQAEKHDIEHYLRLAGPLAEQVASLADHIDRDRQMPAEVG